MMTSGSLPLTKERRPGGIFPTEGQGEPAPQSQPLRANGRAVGRSSQERILTYIALSPAGLVEATVDVGDFLDPPLPFAVFELQDLAARPVKVVGDVGYLLVQTLEGVAAYSPPRLAKSTSNSV